MNAIGGRMSALMIAVVVFSVVGTAGVSLYYQDRVVEAEDRVQEREDRIEKLEANLSETKENLSETRRELNDAELEVEELRGIEQRVQGMEAKNDDLRDLITGQVAGAEEAARERREAIEKLEESREEKREMEDRLREVKREYDALLEDYGGVYEKCETANSCFVSSDRTSPGNYTSPDGF